MDVLPKKTMAKLGSLLLNLAADEFSNHSCNEFNLEKHGFTEDERLAISKLSWQRNGSQEDEERFINNDGISEDWILMLLVASLLDTVAEEKPVCGHVWGSDSENPCVQDKGHSTDIMHKDAAGDTWSIWERGR